MSDTPPESWNLLVSGTHQVATDRLSELHQYITGAVAQFHIDAYDKTEELADEHQSEEGLGAELFKALTDVMLVVLPEAEVAMLAHEAIKGFRDVFIAGVRQAAAGSQRERVTQAKAELRHVLADLNAATIEGANQGWAAAKDAISNDLAALSAAHPEWHNYPFDDRAAEMEGFLSDQIGVQDARVMNPAPEITAALWASFIPVLSKVSAQLQWADMGPWPRWNLLAHMEPSDRPAYLRRMGEDPGDWTEPSAEIRLELEVPWRRE